MRRYIFLVLATLLTWLAAANVAFACQFHYYEPEVPPELR